MANLAVVPILDHGIKGLNAHKVVIPLYELRFAAQMPALITKQFRFVWVLCESIWVLAIDDVVAIPDFFASIHAAIGATTRV